MRKLTNDELGRPSQEEFVDMVKMPVVVVLDCMRSLNNVGSIFRTCDAFVAENLVLCGITATPPNKEMHKTALGAENSVAWSYCSRTTDVVLSLQERGYVVLAIEQVEGASMLNDFKPDPNTKYALVFGNEVMGVDQDVIDLCDGSLEIPQGGTKHSLNVAVSVGVVLWQFFKEFTT